ncbi:MAG TPA: MaoC family dehydratase [bacterium]|nr:MaoC family dehydratase [bacterium]
MSELKIPAVKQAEKSKEVVVDLSKAKFPQYGRVLEDFAEGEVFAHPRGLTIDRAFAVEFATNFMEANPLYLNAEYAKEHGFKDLAVSPLMVMNVALSLGVQNDSEKAIANLGYYDVHFLRAVYPGDTLRALTKVLKRQEKGEGKPGIVTIRTIASNQNDELVLQYDRKIMVAPAGKKSEPTTIPGQPFPDVKNVADIVLHVPKASGELPRDLTGTRTYFEDFAAGDIIVHANGRTMTQEHIPWTYRVMNTHPLHYDRLYSTGRSGPMSGEPIIYGGLVFAWLAGLASRDVSENAIWDLGYTEGYHTQPAYAGDTVYAISRVLDVGAFGQTPLHAGVVTFQLIGIKNIRPKEALEKFGADLFVKENDKKDMGKEKIPEKIFEIERRLLIKKRPA